jgi:putative ABC transport system substrate-binding protein
VASGYVESLNKPGGNVTGVHILNGPAIFKRIEMLHEFVPQAKSFASYTRTGDAVEMPFYQSLQKEAEPLGVNIILLNASRIDELEEIFARAKDANVGGIVVKDHPVFATNGGKPLVDLAARYKLPTAILLASTSPQEVWSVMGRITGRRIVCSASS